MPRNKKSTPYDKIVLNHLVLLTKKQRYKLYDLEPVEAVGLLTQYRIIDGKYGVKHDEVIVKYVITTNVAENYVEAFPAHYQINLPLDDFDIDYGADASSVDLIDIVDRKDGGVASITFDAIYTCPNMQIQGFHKVVIKDIKEMNKTLAFTDF